VGKGEANLYYCGQYCGRRALPGSNGYCGPHNGPQCVACKNFQKHRPENLIPNAFNSEGYPLAKGTNRTDYYCGIYIGNLALPGSDGYCGPTNGPQCKSCYLYQNHLPALNKLIPGYFNSKGNPVCIGDNGVFYCGRYIGNNLKGSDGYCGPTNGPQCHPCKILQNHQPRLHTLQPNSNIAGARICLGEDGKFYCGRFIGNSLAGSDGYCGPTSGPQCSPCIVLQEQLQKQSAAAVKQPLPPGEPEVTDPGSIESKLQCKICFDGEVNCVFVPCGHTACCYSCAAPMKSCPFCRNPIGSIVKMFYM